MSELNEYIVGFIVIFVASFVQGFSGFGFSQVAVPVMSFFMLPSRFIPVALLQSIVLNIIILIESRKNLDFKKLIPLTIAGALGIPLGTYLLIVLNPEIIKLTIGAIIILSSLALFIGFEKPVTNEKFAYIPIGIVSGILNGSITMSGPPVILFFAYQGVEKAKFRANLVMYFFLINIVTVPTYLFGGLIDIGIIKYAIITLPALIVGTICGAIVSRFTKDAIFKKITLILLIALGALSLITAVIKLINN
jgi:uncharacterized protein